MTDTLEAIVGRALAADPTIAAVAGETVLLGPMPEEFPLPAVTFWVPADSPAQTMQGVSTLHDAFVRVHSWAADYATARRLHEAARGVLTGRLLGGDGIRTGVIVEEGAQLFEPEDRAGIWHGVLELRVPYYRR